MVLLGSVLRSRMAEMVANSPFLTLKYASVMFQAINVHHNYALTFTRLEPMKAKFRLLLQNA